MNKQSRKNFLATGTALWAASLIPVSVRAGAGAPKLQETNGIAIALGYKTIASDVDTTKSPKRAGAAGATKLCSKCRLYSAKANGMARRSAIPDKLVAGRGWCNAWIPMA